MNIFIINVILYFLPYILALEVIPEGMSVKYVDESIIEWINITYLRKKRKGKYYVNINGKILQTAGDNVTISGILYENRYIPTLIRASFKLCDFLANEPYLGQMFSKQLPKNITCPLKKGVYYTQFEVHLESFPYALPFTFTSMFTRCMLEVKILSTKTKKLYLKVLAYLKITEQKTDSRTNGTMMPFN